MIKIIENVVPRLTRVTSVQVNQIENVPLEIPTTEERERNTVYEEDESDSSSDYD